MAVNVIKRTWLQDRLVRPETLNGMVFQEEAGAHRFEITGYDSNGNVMAFSGTVTAIFLRPDNTDVPLTGVISNGVAQVTLSQECYQVPGRFGLAIFVNSGNTKTVVYKCIGPVGMTSSGVAASSVVQSVSTLIDRIDAAVNSIPQDYSALSKAVSATCPEMRDGSTGNPWNTDSITTKYIIKIDKSCDELILEYIGSTQAQYYVFGYSVFKGVADGTESYAARTSAASFLDYPDKYVQTEPYVIIPVSQLGDYTHIAFVLWAKSDDTTFIPLRIATEQNNLRVTFRHASYMGHEEINNRSVKVGVQNASRMASPLRLVHFSDLHRDVNALNRIRASAKYVCPNADNIICTGDMVANTYAEITSWWVPEILTCIGNHDTASYDGTYDWTALTMAQRDEMYISPFKSYWGIVHTAGTSYYYKDYPAAHIRLIVMDAMLYSGTPGAEATAQTEWLADLLASAITDSLHVIIAIHAPHGGSVPVACSFTKLGQETMPVNADCNTPDVVINTVATAIGNGLHFIGYICGHTHQDAVWDCTGDRSQLMYNITCAAVDQTAQWVNSDQYRSQELDAFNVLTIDTASTTIKILRGGGANTDVALRPRVSMVIDYSTGKIITDTYASGTQDAVVYGEAQELTDAQKAQARANIGAGSAADVSENTADITANAEEITSLKSAIDVTVDMMTDEYIVDYSQIQTVRCVINSSGNWNATSGSNLGSSSTIAIPNGANKIVLKANSSLNALWALLKTYDPSALTGAADFCTQYVGRQGLTADSGIEIDIPDDAKFLYVQRSPSAGTDQTPSKVSFQSAVVTKNEFIPRGNLVPNYTREYDNTYYYASSTGVSPSSGSSSSYGTLVIPVEPSTHYVCNKLRYLTLVGEDGKSESASLENVTEFTTATTTKKVYAVYYKDNNTKENLIISSGDYLNSEVGQYEIPWLYDKNKKAFENLKNRAFGIVKPFLQYNGNDQSYMFDAPNSIKRDKVACFSCDFSSFGSVEVGLAGALGGNVVSIIIDATNVTVKKSGTSGTGIPHGLTISNRISVVLTQTVDGKLQYEISSNGGKYTGETAYTNGYTRFYFEASNMTASNVDFVSTCKDFNSDVWMFGDSYFSYGDNRWVYYLINNENSGRCLIDAYAGEGSNRALPSLQSYIDLAKPKYILWCVGMNDGSDSGSAPNAAWMSAVNDVLSICNENDITPVFGTIPTVPTINHEQKNAWIRNSGYQYIDFAKAVGAQSDGTWFSGMLSNDNVHPTASGAMALYYQAITDFPQFLQNK